MSLNSAILELTNVSKSYGAAGDAASVSILTGVDLSILNGETLAVVGPSGSGKSTLLNLMGTLDKPSSGFVTVNGTDVTAMDDRALAKIRSQHIGFVFQQHFLLPQCTVLENVIVPTLARSAVAPTGEKIEDRAKRLLARVGLSDRLNHLPGEISGGEKQRTAVVRALINKPAVLLADEPTGALDHSSAENLANLLLELNQEEGVALVLVTHSMPLAALMGRVFEVADGKLLAIPNQGGSAR